MRNFPARAQAEAHTTGGQPVTIGRVVIYTTDGRNGVSYRLPALVTMTEDTYVPGTDLDGPPSAARGEVDLFVMSPESSYHERRVPFDAVGLPRTWAWPERA